MIVDMEAINNEYYVSLEVAKLLKEAGFDWEVMSFYTNDITEGCESEYELRLVKFDNWNGKNKTWCDLVSAPTLDVAQRWLREVKTMHICVKPNEASANCKYFVTVIVNDTKWGNLQDDNRKTIMFDTYEEAQEAGIQKCLTLLLNEDK